MLRTLSRFAAAFEPLRRPAVRTSRVLLLVLVAAVFVACAMKTKPEPAPQPPPPPPPKVVEPPSPPPTEVVLFVTSARLNLRGCPLTKCEVLRVLTRNEKVVLVGEEGAWARVRPMGGEKEGWVMSRFLSKNPVAAGPRSRKSVAPPSAPSASPPQQQPAQPPAPIEEEFVR